MHSRAANITTADALLDAGDIGRCELVRGELIFMSPASGEHGRVTGNLHFLIASYVRRAKAGVVYAAETGFFITRQPDTVRAPDVSFIRRERVSQVPPRGYIPFAPDFAVEVISPDDRAGEIDEKIDDWLNHGVQLLWIADPPRKTVTVYRPNQRAAMVGEGDTLTGEPVLPGLVISVTEIFD